MKNSLIYSIILLAFLSISSCCKDNGTTDTRAKNVEINYGAHALQNMKLYLPADRTPETKVILLVHGGGWVMGYKPDGNVTTFSGRYGWDILNPLLAEGYACAVMKYRTACYNTQPSAFTNDATKYQDQMMEDIDLAIDHLKANAEDYVIADDHFQLLGESAGGHIVMTYAIRADANPAVKSAASMFGPSTLDDNNWQVFLDSLPLVLATAPNYFLKKSDGCVSVTNKQVKTFFSLKSFADHQNIDLTGPDVFLNPLCPNKAENIQNNTPIFIMHGAEDWLVPPSHADAMYDGLITKNGNANCAAGDFSCRYKKSIYEFCGHGWTNGSCDKEKIMNDILEWMNNH